MRIEQANQDVSQFDEAEKKSMRRALLTVLQGSGHGAHQSDSSIKYSPRGLKMSQKTSQFTGHTASWSPTDQKTSRSGERAQSKNTRQRQKNRVASHDAPASRAPGRHGLRRQAGSAVVEFALILPLLLLLLFGIVEFSIALYDKAVITNASREAARAGVIYKVPQMTVAQITSVAQNYASNYLITFGTATPISVAVDQSAGTTTGLPLKVTVTYTYGGLALGTIINPLAGTAKNAMAISAVTTMDYE
ncbi:pilus assembly protein [Caballeronia sp. SEWSISQ10-4 2]|uniref:TadE/TadG family type IV pilus assembly protein n=1 Tax=Caballeronia sp. SEWSISQ10-4 2 TaxID=2937438 RepID=UPI002654287E|nr:TadE/TadG family type IV pilus assembly protein [Caballeronia sp. SEWSISQ10-4 2]MDN7183083.1 pilus assembly protein [Caballeronia sp. SEWSISQ10-4 2]